MKTFVAITLFITTNFVIAEIEIPGVFGECFPIYAATDDSLVLNKEPNSESEKITIPYRNGWRIPAPKSQGMTRVIKTGSLEVLKPDKNLYCSVKPSTGPKYLLTGELVEYLHYYAEGSGVIRFRGGECVAEVLEDFGYFKTITLPEVEVWLRVFYADGTSPGWLLWGDHQARIVGVTC